MNEQLQAAIERLKDNVYALYGELPSKKLPQLIKDVLVAVAAAEQSVKLAEALHEIGRVSFFDSDGAKIARAALAEFNKEQE